MPNFKSIHLHAVYQVEDLVLIKCKLQNLVVKIFLITGLLDEFLHILKFFFSEVVRHIYVIAFYSFKNLLDDVILLPLIDGHLPKIILRDDLILVKNGELIVQVHKIAFEIEVLLFAGHAEKCYMINIIIHILHDFLVGKVTE